MKLKYKAFTFTVNDGTITVELDQGLGLGTLKSDPIPRRFGDLAQDCFAAAARLAFGNRNLVGVKCFKEIELAHVNKLMFGDQSGAGSVFFMPNGVEAFVAVEDTPAFDNMIRAVVFDFAEFKDNLKESS